MPGAATVDVDFTLAVHNRTGKYFIGKDLIDGVPDLIGRTYYGPAALPAPPNGVVGRILARVQGWQVQAFSGQRRLPLPRRTSRRPILHLDPFTVGSTILKPQDVVLCHDIGPITHPSLFEERVSAAYEAIYAEVARVGPHLVFVSAASMAEFHDRYDADPRRSLVIYPPIALSHGAAPPMHVDAVSGPFLLTVGSIGARKDQLSCIRAFGASGLAERGYRYVLCGGREPGFEEVAAAARSTPGVVLLPYVTDGQLAWLYQHAESFILASRLEGFGMPVAEAIAHGLVPIVTRNSVLEEVAGEGAQLVGAGNIDEIAAAMTDAAAMPADERLNRLSALQVAIQRFTPERFIRLWRAKLQAVLDEASARPRPGLGMG